MATIILDATSQMNMVRRLPLTQATMERLGGVVLRGHHKTNMGSYENVRDLFAGHEGGQRWGVTEKYKEQGWTTMILEEAPTMTLDGRNFSMNFEMAYQYLWTSSPKRSGKCLMEKLNHEPQFAVIEDFLDMSLIHI